jgi:hypothetical protein
MFIFEFMTGGTGSVQVIINPYKPLHPDLNTLGV